MRGLVRPVSVGQILPRGSGAQNPQHAIEDLASIAPGPAAPIGPHWVLGEDGTNDIPLVFGQIHP